MTESMIELATGICTGYDDALAQLTEIQGALVEAANKLDVGLAGGGTHPFQHWAQQRIFDKPRFLQLSELYGYLSKQFTVFGQHVHLGCPDADTALYTLHCISRFIPHFIALSASSPYVQGEDTGFHSARLNSVFAFPLSGRAPFALSWEDFERYFDKMTATGVVKSMKDFYWDIRPKPEYGTIEVRVMGTHRCLHPDPGGVHPARAAFHAAGGRLPRLHLQPLPSLPLRLRRHLRRPRHPRAPHPARGPHPHLGQAGRSRCGLQGRCRPARTARRRERARQRRAMDPCGPWT
jgi:hypothetical protein